MDNPSYKALFTMPPDMYGGALFSEDKLYRHALWRYWGNGPLRVVDCTIKDAWLKAWQLDKLKYVLWIGHNPSKADATTNDLTTLREVGFTKRLGYDSYIKMNISDRIATNPDDLPPCCLLQSPKAIEMLAHAVAHASVVIISTGNPHKLLKRLAHNTIRELTGTVEMQCLGLTTAGWPKHPSRISGKTPFEIFR